VEEPNVYRLAALVFLLLSGPVSASIDVSPTSEPPVLDGRMDDPCWATAATLDLAWEIDPGDRTPAAVATTCLITHDRDHLYVAFRAFDPEPGRIRANLADRDDAFSDDWVGLVIDPFADRRRAFQFLVSAGGVQMDLTWSETSEEGDDPAWDADWSSAAAVDALGYAVEIAVPFGSLRFAPTDDQRTWGVLAYRHHPRSVERMTCSSPLDPDVNCELCQAVDLVGFRDISAGRSLELNPTYTVSRTDLRADFPDGDMVAGRPAWDLGLSARWGVTSNISLDGALNPDFSQVEADELQLDVNTRYALFYEEKRPVFLEGADLFETTLPAVHTRMVVSPEWVLKTSGKDGRNAVGAFVARDEWTNVMAYGASGSSMRTLERDNTSAVARWRRDVGEESTVGALVTGRDGGGYSNLAGGLDAAIRLAPSHRLDAQVLSSASTLDDETAAALGSAATAGDHDGAAVSLIYSHDSRDWSWLAAWERVSRDFRADLGWVPRVDTEQRDLGVWRSWWRPAGAGVHFVGLGLHGTEIRDTDGLLTDRQVQAEINVMGPLQSRLWLATSVLRERFLGVDYEQTIFEGKVGARPVDALKGWFAFWSGDEVDYMNARPATDWGLGPGVTWTPNARVEVVASWIRTALSSGGGRVYAVNLADARVQLALTRRTHLRLTVQAQLSDFYSDPADGPATVAAEQDEVFSQLLFSFRASPESVVFLGTTDRRLGDHVTPSTVHDRTYFLKVGYAWRP